MRSQVRLILLSVFFALAAGLGLWLESRSYSLLLQVLTGVLGLLAFGVAAYALTKRQTSEATRLSARGLWKLAFFAIAMTFVFAIIMLCIIVGYVLWHFVLAFSAIYT